MFIKELGFAFCTVIGFSILFNIPRKLIVSASTIGMLGWLVYSGSMLLGYDAMAAALCGAFTIGLCGEGFARFKKVPASLFIIPGIIPIVPGYGLYDTMLFAVQNQYENAVTKGIESLIITVSIACGLILATSIVRLADKREVL